MNTTVSILADIPEELNDSLLRYLDAHPDWDRDRVLAAALSLFLLQNGNFDAANANRSYRTTAKVYLNALFQQPA